MESKPNIASLTTPNTEMEQSISPRDSPMSKVDPDIPIKQEPQQLEIDEELESAEQHPIKRTKKAIARTTEFFRKLFAKRRGQANIECRKCGHRIKLMRTGGRGATLCISSIGFRQHAITHVDKPMYSCVQCGQTCKTLYHIRDHVLKLHQSSPDHHSDHSDSYEKDIFKMAKECFGEKSDDSDDNPIKIRYAIMQYMTKLYRANWKNSARISCHLCGLCLSVQHGNRRALQLNRALYHAAIHLEKFLFSCRHCSYQSITRTAMNIHLRNHHALGAHPGNHVNRMHEFKDELCDLFVRCYGKGQHAGTMGATQDPETNKAAIPENIIRSRGGPNTIFTERQLHCHRLLVKYAKQGSIKCRICSHLVNVKQAGANFSNQRAIWHASTHVEKPLYKCKKCDKDIHVMSSVYRHMKKEHGITKGVAKEFEDRSSELHKEILDALTRSFDWTGIDGSAEDSSDDDWSEEM